MSTNFKPNLTPQQIFDYGSFGGSYWRPIDGYVDEHLELPNEWWSNINDNLLTSTVDNKEVNRYKVRAGSSLENWRDKGWIKENIDPYGWVQWYCHYHAGRRTIDDSRQIQRWLNFAGPNGRWRRRLISSIKKKAGQYDDYSISPVIRQSLQHWAYELTQEDFEWL